MEPFDNIVKAQGIYKKMIACETPAAFKKIFSDSIYKYSLDDFYPVVVRAELVAAIAFCAREIAKRPELDFTAYLYDGFGLKPHHYIDLVTQAAADIMEYDVDMVEDIFRGFDFIVENGIVAAHPAVEESKVLDFNQARLRKRAGNAG